LAGFAFAKRYSTQEINWNPESNKSGFIEQDILLEATVALMGQRRPKEKAG